MMTDIAKKHPRLFYISIWFIVVLIHALVLNTMYDISLRVSFIDALTFNTIYALIGGGLWYMVRFSNLQSRPVPELIFNHLAGNAVTIFIWLSISFFMLKAMLGKNAEYLEFLKTSLVVRGISGVLYYAVIVTIYYLIISFKELKEKMEREAQLNSMLRDAELKMLRSQIRPHFLFNSLNSISSLTISNPERAQEMVIKLSEFMRYSLSYKDEKLIPLEQEMYHIQLYLDIEKVRFGKKLKVNLHIPDKCKNYLLPALILQPLVENAVKYGLYEATGEIAINLNASCDDGYLAVTTGNDFDPESTPKKGTGTGLKNIEKRLEAIYSGLDLMKIKKTENYFEVELKIPQYAKN